MSQKTAETESNFDDVNEDNVENLINQMQQEGGKEEEEAEDLDLEKTQDEPEGNPKDEPKPAEAEQPKPQVLVTRDGKHEIPYSVLEHERNRSRELQRELDAIKAEKASQALQKPEAAPQDEPGTSTDMDEESLAAFREEFGDEAADAEIKRRAHYSNLEKRQKDLEKDLQEQKKWREDQEAKSQQTVLSEINEAIDSIPELRNWRDESDPMWDAAVALDNRLQNDPKFTGLSFRERFGVVVERLTGRKSQNSNTPSAEELLEQKLKQKEQSASRSTPSTLSDLPGGQMPDQSVTDTLERLTPSQLEAKFATMTDDQQNEYLSKL